LQTAGTSEVTPANSLVDTLLEPEYIPLEFLPEEFLPIFTTPVDVCLKTWALQVSLPSLTPGSRQRILMFPCGFCFLSHPSHQGIRPGRLLSKERAIGGLFRSEQSFSVILGGCFALRAFGNAGFHSNGYHA
jgi:hypothetical protein